MRRALSALALACASGCARTPDPSTSPKPSAAPTAPASVDAGADVDRGRAFGLPMPQQYPHFVWDAAAADAAARDAGAAPPTVSARPPGTGRTSE
jgi:hypothetical protein